MLMLYSSAVKEQSLYNPIKTEVHSACYLQAAKWADLNVLQIELSTSFQLPVGGARGYL